MGGETFYSGSLNREYDDMRDHRGEIRGEKVQVYDKVGWRRTLISARNGILSHKG